MLVSALFLFSVQLGSISYLWNLNLGISKTKLCLKKKLYNLIDLSVFFNPSCKFTHACNQLSVHLLETY